jgi:ketosteroid isomerase-like protein
MPEESTPSDLVVRAQRVAEATNRGDLNAILSVFAADAVYESENLGTRLQGVAAIRGFFEDWFASYEEFEIVNEELLDLGNGVTFSVGVMRGRPVGSSGHVPFRVASVAVWVEGKVMRFKTYTDVDAARAAAERLAQERG